MKKRGRESLVSSKKGQVTIFVIVAIVIIAAVVLFFTLSDSGKKIINTITGKQVDVNGQFTDCVSNNKNILNNLSLIELQGGVVNPKNYVLYNNTKIEYLCYTNQYYQTCVMQHPLLLNEINSEIQKVAEPEIRACMATLKNDLESSGNTVSLGVLNFTTDINTQALEFKIRYPITVVKQDTKRYENFDIKDNTNAYQLLMIATSILNYEARYGDTDILTYMILYPGVKVDKERRDDGSKIYILTDRNSGEKFEFAVRSGVVKPGY